MGDFGSQGSGTGLCCYEDESAGTTKVSGHLDHADMSLFGRGTCEGRDATPVPFFSGDAQARPFRSIGFGDLMISAWDDRDLEDDDLNGF